MNKTSSLLSSSIKSDRHYITGLLLNKNVEFKFSAHDAFLEITYIRQAQKQIIRTIQNLNACSIIKSDHSQVSASENCKRGYEIQQSNGLHMDTWHLDWRFHLVRSTVAIMKEMITKYCWSHKWFRICFCFSIFPIIFTFTVIWPLHLATWGLQ